MARYIQFVTADDSTILVEVDPSDIPASEAAEQGIIKAGVPERMSDTVWKAKEMFDETLDRVVRQNVHALMQSVRNIGEPLDAVEFAFTLKATGELGILAVGKLGGEANFSIKLTWKPPHETGAVK